MPCEPNSAEPSELAKINLVTWIVIPPKVVGVVNPPFLGRFDSPLTIRNNQLSGWYLFNVGLFR